MSSDESSLSSAPSVISDEEFTSKPAAKGGLDRFFKPNASASPPPTKKKRPASPPHEYVLADNADIAFIVMFRSRFSGAFPKSLPHYGPQDIEKGVVDSLPDENVEKLLCALIGLVLNRKKDVERGHYQRALEEAIQTNANQWPWAWSGKNPLHGGNSFNTMSPAERLTLLKALINWSLNSSETVQAILKESYKQQRHDDDLNQPLSVQPWGRDGDKRRFWLIEGQDDTHFRLYRESNPALKHNTWRSLAGSIDELKAVGERLGEEGTQAARRLKERIMAAIPRFEAGEEKRKRRDYRNSRKAQFTRPEPGFSLYEGRTRGKRIRYNFSDDDGDGSDVLSTRRSNRQSGISTPAEPAAPTYTASGRQVKSRVGGAYGETILSGQHEPATAPPTSGGDDLTVAEESSLPRTRNRGMAPLIVVNGRKKKHIDGYNSLDEMDDESDASSSGGDWDGGEDDEDVVLADDVDDEDEEDAEMSDSDNGQDGEDGDLAGKGSLVVSLRYQKPPRSSNIAHVSDLHANGFQNPPAPPGDSTLQTTVANGHHENFTNGYHLSSEDTPMQQGFANTYPKQARPATTCLTQNIES